MKNVSFHRYVISLICVAILSGGGVYIWQKSTAATQSPQNQPTVATSNELEKVQTLFDQIRANYYQEVDEDVLVEGALKGMTDALGDPYTTYLSESAANELDQSLSSSFEGIGATLTLVNDYPEVAQAPIKNSPAEKNGLRLNDRILKVDGKETKGLSLTEVVNNIRGKKGTTVKLTIQREKETFDVSITRDTLWLYTTSEIDAY